MNNEYKITYILVDENGRHVGAGVTDGVLEKELGVETLIQFK